MNAFFVKFQLVFAFLIGIKYATGQHIIIKNDIISIETDSIATLVIPEYRGQCFWQQSFDNINWITLSQLDSDTLNISTSFDAYYRAKIVDGNCEPSFSDTVGIIMPDSLKRDFSSMIYEYAFPDSTNYVDVIWGNDTIVCRKIDGKYIFQGDIILSEEQIKKMTETKGAFYPLNSFQLWPKNTVYYTIESGFPDVYRIEKAISEWESKTNIKFINRTNEPYYTIFRSNNSVSNSNVGMIKGKPGEINIRVNAEYGTIIHEIGHTIGLLHEHSRKDRNSFVFIHYDNLPSQTQDDIDYLRANYDISKNSYTVSEFDLNSIMMYGPRDAKALDPNKPVITKTDNSLYMPNRSYLSKKDVETINALYKPIDPEIATLYINNIASNQATSGINVIFDGRPSVEMCGVCWSSKGIPTIEDHKTFDGIGFGTFSSTLNDLNSNTTYYVRAYATDKNSKTFYGNLLTFKTKPNLPSVSFADNISAITQNSAVCGVVVSHDGGADVTARGVCWSTWKNPTISSSNKTFDGFGTGSFISNITGLNPNTIYYVRAYAKNSAGTAYSNEVTFTTIKEDIAYGSVTDIDGNEYKTVKIGEQWWMAENLKTTKYNDGNSIPNITGDGAWAMMTSGAYCWYNNDISNKNIYGALYNWHTINTQKLCPAGWHVPSDNEWTTLATTLGGRNSAGSKLKEIGTTHWRSPNTGATNETGFTALPGGYRRGDGPFGYDAHYGTLGTGGHWWSSTVVGPDSPDSWGEFMYYDKGTFPNYGHRKVAGFSVRCVKDNASTLPDLTISAPVSGSIQAGTSKQIQVTVTKTGGNLANGAYAEAHLYLSKTPTLDSEKVQLWISNNSTPDFPNSVLNSSGSKTVTATVTIPANTVAGNYYIIAVVDELKFHQETNETNNTQIYPIAITAQTILPDLTISATVSGSIQAGTSKQIQVAVTKTGGSLTNGAYVEAHLYLSKTPTLDSEKVQLWISNNSTPDFPKSVLNSSGSKTVTATVNIPSNTTAGNYYIIAVVDEVNYHPEANESNNIQNYLISVTAQSSNQTGTFTDSRDNKTYKWVKIGDQTWMAENLAYLPSVSPASHGSGTIPYYYVYGYQGTDVALAKQNSNYATYGVLYNWAAALSGCPSGWHLPSDEEWTTLTAYLGGENVAGGKMKETGTTHWNSPNTGATNESGFSGLPGGGRGYGGTFLDIGTRGYWWSSTELNSSGVWYRTLDHPGTVLFQANSFNVIGFSVRCVKNNISELPDLSISAPVTGSIQAGTSKQIQVTVTKAGSNLNNGNYVEAHLYLSKTNTLGSDKVQLWVSNNSTPDFPNSVLNSSSSKTVTATVSIPSNTPAGNYYIIAVVDEVNYHQEVNETNNTQSYPLTITSQTSLPDLSISAPVSGSIQAGISKQIQVTVTKAGGNLTNGTFVEAHLYLSKTNTLGSEKIKLWVSNNNTPDFPNSVLNSNGSKSVTATVTIPSNTVAGNYYIIAVVDEVNYHPEANESNNTQNYPLTVTAQSSNQTGTFTDSRDNKSYQWVKIGDQTWMAENLAYLPTVSPSTQGSATAPYYYVYGYQGTDVVAAKTLDNYKTYGVLYNWPGALTACPAGWHLPSDAEWTQLENYLITNGYNYDGTTTGNKIAKSLAATTNWYSDGGTGTPGNNISLNNKSDFSALPGGRRYYLNGTFIYVGYYGGWWDNMESSSSYAWYRYLNYGNTAVYRNESDRADGFSVRCFKD